MNDEEGKEIHQQLFYERQKEEAAYKPKGLSRSRNNNIVAGVCAGVAEHFNVDPSTIRVGAILTLLLGGYSMVVYLLLTLLLPLDKVKEPLTQSQIQQQQKENYRTVLSGFTILIGVHFTLIQIGLFSSIPFIGISNGISFAFFVIALGFVLLVNSKNIQMPNMSVPQNFYLSKKDKVFWGVCGGFAEYTNIDSTSLRFIVILLTALTLGLFALGYLLLAISSPKQINNGEPNE